MTEAVLQVAPKRVLEVGTGSGYQAAILGALGLEVYTVERIGDLLRQARKRFRALGMNIRTKHDDGRAGWAEHGPFDAIVVTAAAPALVDELVGQLAEGGRLVAPVGGGRAVAGAAGPQTRWQHRTTRAGAGHVRAAAVWHARLIHGAGLHEIFGPLYERAMKWAAHERAPTYLTVLSF